ncbi:TPA: glycogen/starch/alpha-glucan phosphorylase [Klebsiella pneumoniae]|nr:glycogen/starch/alpha-glucan phosphorylase [Klebsiella pneumoniae]
MTSVQFLFHFHAKKNAALHELYQNPEEWAYKAMLNIANMGYFSSDRTIQEYAKYIWHIDPVRL